MRCVPPPASLTRVKPPPARAPLLITLRARDVTTYLVTNQITPFFCFKSPEWIVTPSIHKPGKRCDNTIRAGGRGTDGRREKKGRDLVRAQVTDREEREGSARFLLLVRSDGVRRRRRRRRAVESFPADADADAASPPSAHRRRRPVNRRTAAAAAAAQRGGRRLKIPPPPPLIPIVAPPQTHTEARRGRGVKSLSPSSHREQRQPLFLNEPYPLVLLLPPPSAHLPSPQIGVLNGAAPFRERGAPPPSPLPPAVRPPIRPSGGF